MLKLPVRRNRIDYRRTLASFVARPGPFLSLYLDVRPGAARRSVEQRLLDALDAHMRSDGESVSPEQWTAAGRALSMIEADDATLVSFVDRTGMALTTGYPEPPATDSVTVDVLPRLGPMLRAEQSLVHHLVVVYEGSRLGMAAVPRHGEAVDTLLDVEDADSVPALVQRAARASNTGLVVVCGTDEHLPGLLHQVRVGLLADVVVAHIVTDGLDDDALADRIVAEVSAHAARRTVELLRLWRFHHAHGEAVAGIADTTAAIAGGRSGLVLLNDDQNDRRTALIGEGGAVGRLTDVVVAAALRADCPLHIVPAVEATLDEGLGAILSSRADPADLDQLLEL